MQHLDWLLGTWNSYPRSVYPTQDKSSMGTVKEKQDEESETRIITRVVRK